MFKKTKMSYLAHKEKRFDSMWGVVHPGNALCYSIHRKKYEAETERKKNAYAYKVVRIKIIPDYEYDKYGKDVYCY